MFHIQALRDEGRLHIHGARVLAVDGNGPLDDTIRSRATQRVTQFESDVVVQATGLDTAVAFAKSSLLSSLLKSGLAVADAGAGRIVNEAEGKTHGCIEAVG